MALQRMISILALLSIHFAGSECGIPFVYTTADPNDPRNVAKLREALVDVGISPNGIKTKSFLEKCEIIRDVYKATYTNELGQECFIKWHVNMFFGIQTPKMPTCENLPLGNGPDQIRVVGVPQYQTSVVYTPQRIYQPPVVYKTPTVISQTSRPATCYACNGKRAVTMSHRSNHVPTARRYYGENRRQNVTNNENWKTMTPKRGTNEISQIPATMARTIQRTTNLGENPKIQTLETNQSPYYWLGQRKIMPIYKKSTPVLKKPVTVEHLFVKPAKV